MKFNVKMVLQYIIYGISLGCTSFVIMCLGFFAAGGKDFLAPVFANFAKQAVGAMIVGIACGGTAIVYRCGGLSRLAQTAIHFFVGMGVFYPVAIYLGWIPFHPGKPLFSVMQFLLACGIFMAIRFCFYLFYRKEAKEINERLKELEKDGDDTVPPTSI